MRERYREIERENFIKAQKEQKEEREREIKSG